MQEKFEKLFYEFVPQETHWGDWILSPQAYFRGDTDMPGAGINLGFQVFLKPVRLETEPHFHREDEYLVFLGAQLPDVFSAWDAEVHFYMGPTYDTMEKVVITEPTIIHLPKGWWHSPLDFVRIDKPVLFQAVMQSGRCGLVKYVQRKDTGEKQYLYMGDENIRSCVLDPSKKCTYCGYCFSHRDKIPPRPYDFVPWTVVNEDGVKLYSDTGAYDPEKAPDSAECVVTEGYKSKPYSDATVLKAPKPALSDEVAKNVLACPKEKTQWGPWCPSPQFYFRGETYMEGATWHCGYQIFTGPNDMEDCHFHQGAEEYIFFMGANPMDIFDFDAEVEMTIGDDPDHMESKIITKPTVVRLPANVWHCPIKFRNVKKPLLFQAAFMDGTWGTITRSRIQLTDEQKAKMPFAREHTYNYMGDNVRFCRYNPKKRCNICGKCFSQMRRPEGKPEEKKED
ncbi:MAG: hypothetical protein J5633_04970 [Oscillospiraceae bacterium]|nr:hypothetical protein [Oscillospiraceae bacterium]